MMSPKKRKVDDDSPGAAASGADASGPAPKKSKKEIKAEQLARAKAWHDARASKAKAATASPTAPPPFSVGTTTPSKSSGAAAKRRRTTTPSGGGRKSTGVMSSGGGIGRALDSPPPPPSSFSEREDGGDTPARKSRRSMGSAPAFAYAPAAREEEEEESEPRMREVAMAGSDGSRGEKNSSANEKKRRDGLAAIRALKKARASKGIAADQTEKRKSPHPKNDSPDPPTSASSAVAVARSSTTATASSDAPVAHAAVSTVGVKSAPKRNKPPAAVASLFSSKSAYKYSSSLQTRQVYNPNRPFPSTGRALPAEAYAGCGPICGVGARDPPCASASDGRNGSNDERKMPSRPSSPGRNEIVPLHPKPSPPGRNHNWEEVDGDAKPAAVVGGELIEAPVTATSAPVAASPALYAAISRAKAIVSLASAGNQRRRETIGIRGSSGVMPTEQQMDAANATLDDENNGGVRGRPMERISSVDWDGSRGRSVDPPMIDSSSIPYSATLKKFRGSGGTNKSPEGHSEREPDNVITTTDAGEHTSEVGKVEEAKLSALATSPSDFDKPPSFLRRLCICIGKLLMFVQFGIGLSYLMTAYYLNDFVPIGNFTTTPSNTPEEHYVYCFMDHPHSDVVSDYGDQNLYDERKCEGKHKQCPQWGRCRTGKLLDCTDGAGTFAGRNLFVSNEKQDECVVSPEANELVEAVKESLVSMTTDQICHAEVEGVMLKNDTFPLFHLEKVATKVRDLHDGGFAFVSSDLLLWLSPAFDSNSVRFGSLSGDDEEDTNAMGLSDGVSPDSLHLPSSCKMKLLFWELLGYFTHSALALLKYLARVAFFVVCNYPTHSFCAMASWKLFVVVQRKRKHRAKVRELFGIVREAAYDRLSECDDHMGYAALLLRDDVGHDIYPTSFVQRQFLNDYVWPRVVLEVRADNRVRKFRKMTAGKELEHWEFAIQSKKGRRLRKSLGTPHGTPGGANGSGVKVEDVSSKRDP
ncbi:hypothetical protein ACHAW5_003369 [Stephanodiscus triporus]|uniref:Uncharacterized protein n=1 Tax=Stephanodiscus triporus TaxID=2934178 RepID=A0ABD3QTT7_9STRA